jgi:hypothetical protein
MRAFLLIVGMVLVIALIAVGAVLYPSPGFFGWALAVVVLGTALEFELRRRDMHRPGASARRETLGQVLKSGSFLRFCPPLPVAIALVAMAVAANTGPPGLILVPPAIVMMVSTARQRRAAAKDTADRRRGRGG